MPKFRVTRVWTVEAGSQSEAASMTYDAPVDVLDIIEAPAQRVGDGVFYQDKAALDRAWELYEQLSMWTPVANSDYTTYPLPPLGKLLTHVSLLDLSRIFDVAITAYRMRRNCEEITDA